jgi:hypothetical protein
MNRTIVLYATLALLAWPVGKLAGWADVRSVNLDSAEIGGCYQIFVSHALNMGGIMQNREYSGDDFYEEEEYNWIYGWGMGIPFKDRIEVGIWLYGPFWSIWPAMLKPAGFELQTKVKLVQWEKNTSVWCRLMYPLGGRKITMIGKTVLLYVKLTPRVFTCQSFIPTDLNPTSNSILLPVSTATG